MRRLFIVGFPGLHGGANTELHHQIILWRKAFPEIQLTIIPTMAGWQHEPLLPEMKELDIAVVEPMNFEMIRAEDAVINFCSKEFLLALDKINKRTPKTIFVNCMTWLFEDELAQAAKNNISFFLYQRDGVKAVHELELKKVGSKAKFITFKPYFESSQFPYTFSDHETTNIGRISRADPYKFSPNTLHIYEYITSPKWKRGIFLGFSDQVQQKIGKPFPWVRIHANQTTLSVQSFYNEVDFIVQPSDTNENLPRIGFEAMHSGVPLVVDARGGWKHMIEHGKSGFLCKDDREFIYWGTRLSFEPELREQIAQGALQRVNELASFESSKASWQNVFDQVYA